MVTDSWVTSKTKISLFADERVKGTQVSVDITKGVVHLRGKVDSAEAKSAASEIVQGIEGAKSVKNDLQVVAPTARKAVDASDSDIAKVVGTDTTLRRSAESCRSRSTYWRAIRSYSDSGADRLEWAICAPTVGRGRNGSGWRST